MSSSRKARASAVNSVLINDDSTITKSPRTKKTINDRSSNSNSNALMPNRQTEKTITELEQFLSSNGYSIIRGSYIGSGDNAVLSFIKATYMGYPVYIDLDQDFTTLSPLEKDLSVVEILPGEVSILQDNEWAERCTSIDCGTMLECSGKFCAIRRDPTNGFIKRTDYVLTTKPIQRNVQGMDDSFAYPVIAISEIISNNRAVVMSIKRHSTRLRHKAMKHYVEIRQETNYIMDSLIVANSKIDKLLDYAQREIEDSYINSASNLEKCVYPPSVEDEEYVNKSISKFNAINNERELLYRDVEFLNTVNEELTNVIEQITSLYISIRQRVDQYDTLS